MSGNVWEWTRSLWGKDLHAPIFTYPYRSDDGREDLKASNEIPRVLRGGAWGDHQGVRCAYRDGDDPQGVVDVMGLRLVVAVRP